ncbi:hypothetical protein D3C73_667080 [compost metagenome]
MIDAASHLDALHARAQPDIGQDVRHAGHDLGHPFRALGQDLVVVARCLAHHLPDVEYECLTDGVVEKVAHRVDEDLARFFPAVRNGEGGGVFSDDSVPDGPLAALASQPLILRDAHRLEATRHLHRIAVGAAGRDDGTSRDGIPGGIGPLDLRLSH